MRIVLVADSFPPQRTSSAVQLRDLAREFVRQGHELTVMLPDPELESPWKSDEFDGARILRLRAPRTKDVSYARRTLAEMAMPFFMLRNLGKSPLADQKWDGVVWYAPSIFHGPLVSSLKRRSGCRGYLIVRDIFPEWAVDLGLMKRGLPYHFFNAVAQYQYSLAEVIGVQTEGNLAYFDRWAEKPSRDLEVLQNWLDEPIRIPCPIRIEDTLLAGRRVFVYAGNMGVAQRLDIIIDLAKRMIDRPDIGFIFVGRGSEVTRLKDKAASLGLSNTLFFDEIEPDQISDLYAQCTVGIVSLDPRHRSHNIPGKFLTYMQNGLPVLANINAGNDLARMIRQAGLGEVCETDQIDDLFVLAEKLLNRISAETNFSERCRRFFDRNFAVRKAVLQITNSRLAG